MANAAVSVRRAVALAGACLLVLGTGATGTSSGQAPLPSPIRAPFAPVASPAADGAAEPNLFADAKGRVWLSWLEPRTGGGHRFRLSSLTGGKWSAPVTIAEGANFLANWADFPAVFVSSNGTMAAHWLERGAARGAYGIRVSMSKDAGRTWGAPFTPHRDASPTEHGFVSFYEAPGGDIGLVWLDGREMAGGHAAGGHGGMAIRTALLKNGAAGEEIVLDPRTCECCQTSAARAGDSVLVVYRDRSDKEIRDTSILRFSGGKWSAPVTVHADNWELTGCPVNGPVVTGSGNAAAVSWFTGTGNVPKTLVAFSADAGRTFGAPIRLHADTTVTLGRLAMVMPSADRVLVSSLERATAGARIVLRDVRRDGRVSDPVEISAATPDRSGGFARLARAGSTIVVAWTDVKPGSRSTVRTAIAEVR